MFASIFDPFFDGLASILSAIYTVIPDYGVAIAGLTLFVMVILTPLTLKGTRSMLMMQAVQPQLKRLQQEYKDDRQRLNEELLKFYKENNINPLSGCLPLLIQMPVFIILYRVIYGLTRIKENFNLPNGQHVARGFSPQHLHSGKLFDALIGQTTMKAWGMDLATSAKDMLNNGGLVKTLPYIAMIVVVAATSFIQQKQITSRNPAAAQNPQQQMLMKLGPIMITGFSIIVPGALVIYFLVSNLYRVGQQAIITKHIYGTPEAKELLERQAREAEAHRAKQGGAAPKSFLDRLLGDAKPRINETRKGSARSNGAAGDKKPEGPSRPHGPRSGGGRTTPAGRRSSQHRKKKRK